MSQAARIWVLVALCGSGIASAQDVSAVSQEPGMRDLATARALGMGGAYRSLGIGGESVTGNPAAMSLYKRYMVDLSGAWDWQSKFGFANATVLDSSTNVLAAGVAYNFVSLGRGETHRNAHLNTLALSLPISDTLMIGTSGRYVLMTGARDTNAITMDAGILVHVASVLVGFSGHNLIDIANPDLTRYYALSVAYSAGPLNVVADLRGDFGVPGKSVALAFNAGAEYVIGNYVPVRAGYSLDRITDRQDLSIGAGFIADNMGIDVAYRHELGGLDGHLIALTLRFTSTPER